MGRNSCATATMPHAAVATGRPPGISCGTCWPGWGHGPNPTSTSLVFSSSRGPSLITLGTSTLAWKIWWRCACAACSRERPFSTWTSPPWVRRTSGLSRSGTAWAILIGSRPRRHSAQTPFRSTSLSGTRQWSRRHGELSKICPRSWLAQLDTRCHPPFRIDL